MTMNTAHNFRKRSLGWSMVALGVMVAFTAEAQQLSRQSQFIQNPFLVKLKYAA